MGVTLLRRVNDPKLGGIWNAGETVGFAPEVEADLIARGVAVPRKAPSAPPAHKQVTSPVKK